MRTAGKRKRVSGRGFVFSGVMAVLVLMVCISVSSVVLAGSNKKEEPVYKYYTAIEIKPGDTLWSIANEYCGHMNMSVNDYIQEVKELNHLSSDSITSGQYLTVMYVSAEYKD